MIQYAFLYTFIIFMYIEYILCMKWKKEMIALTWAKAFDLVCKSSQYYCLTICMSQNWCCIAGMVLSFPVL